VCPPSWLGLTSHYRGVFALQIALSAFPPRPNASPNVSFNQDSLSGDRIYLVFCFIDLVIYRGQPGCSSIGLALGPPRRAELRRPL
jgi:hypothetical protein